LTEEGVEGCGNDNSGKHKWDGSEGTQNGFATEVITGEEVGRGKSEQER